VIGTVAVVVPASNEQAHIGECLYALAGARDHALTNRADQVEVRILVVLDSCVDGTADVVGQHPGIDAVHCNAGQVGAARAFGAQHLLNSCPRPRSQIWFANTDADSHVPIDWLTSMLSHADRGTHVVLGTVRPDDDLDVRRRHAWLSRHRLRRGHRHVHGANFGIRADTYLDLGGWPGVTTGEDVALAHRAATSGQVRVVRTAAIPVTTSSRLTGRAPDGFAGYLHALIADTPTASPMSTAPIRDRMNA
jgi:glycosyl transferase family 2